MPISLFRHLRRLVFVLLLATLAAPRCRGAVSANLPGDWPTYGNGPTHSGYFPGTLNGLPFVFKWKTTLPHYAVSQAAIGNGQAFVCVGYYYSAMSVRAFDVSNGQQLWNTPFASAYALDPPTYDSGSVYVQHNNNASSHLWSFNAMTRQTNWSTLYNDQSTHMAPIVGDGTVYADTGYYSELTGYNRTNGAVRFSVSTLGGSGCNDWSPAYYGGKVYTWVNGYFAEQNPLTGARNWVLTNATESEFAY